MLLSDVKLGLPAMELAADRQRSVQTIAVAGGKGGTGKTSIAVNLAMALTGYGANTMLLDAALGMANVDVMLGLQPAASLLDVMEGTCTLEDIVIDGPAGIRILPGASGCKYLSGLDAVGCGRLVHAFSNLKSRIDTLVIDTAAGISESAASFCRASNHVLVVTCNEPAAIRDTIAQIRYLHNTNAIAHFHVLANMVTDAREGDELFRKMLGMIGDDLEISLTYAGQIPRDDCLVKSVANHQAVVNMHPGSSSAVAINNLARRTIGWPRPTVPSGQLEFFVERTLQQNSVEMEVLS